MIVKCALGLVCSCFFAMSIASAEPMADWRDCADCPQMVRIPTGSFVMGVGSADAHAGVGRAELSSVVVKIDRPFALGRTEVTRREYLLFVADSGYDGTGPCITWSEKLGRFNADRDRGPSNPGRPQTIQDDHPAACVSWADAKAYVAWLTDRTGKPYRLPSEAEWEYATRAGSGGVYPWGDAATDACEFANLYDQSAHESYELGWSAVQCRDGYPDVAPVAAFAPNAFGLYDMIGNLAEWVEDCYTDSYVGRPSDGRAWVWTGGCSQRVVRGASWTSPAEHARSAFRDHAESGMRADFLGFRVAVDIDSNRETR
jgi:formylglycine-generating enzyme required for sulfatase activity